MRGLGSGHTRTGVRAESLSTCHFAFDQAVITLCRFSISFVPSRHHVDGWKVVGKFLKVISLLFPLVLWSHLVVAQDSSGYQAPKQDLVRFACQRFDRFDSFDEQYLDRVILLDQLSVDVINPMQAGGIRTAPASVMIDPNHPRRTYSGATKFRLRIYRASLRSNEKSVAQIIEELESQKAEMDLMGDGGREDSNFYFGSHELDGRLKGMIIYDLGSQPLEALLETEHGGFYTLGDGEYYCQQPLLISK